MKPLLSVAFALGVGMATSVELELVPDTPQWAAFRDGNGPWQVHPPSQTRYQSEARERFYEWVVVCAGNVTHLRMAADEIPSLRWQCQDGSKPHEPAPEQLVEVKVTLKGLNVSRSRARQSATLYIGRSGQLNGLNTPTMSLELPSSSAPDLIATRKLLTSNAPDRMLLFRQFQPQTGVLELDFSGPKALPLTAYILQVGGRQITGQPTAPASVRWHSCGGAVAWLGDSVGESNAAFYGRLPTSAVRPCDRYEFSSFAIESSENGNGDFQMAFRFLNDPRDVLLPLPPLPKGPEVRLENGHPVANRPENQPSSLSSLAFPLLSTFGFGDQEHRWETWQPGTAAQSYTPPELRGLGGWNPEWELRGSVLDWSYGVLLGTGTPIQTLRAFQTNSITGFEGPLEAFDGLYVGFTGVGGRLRAPTQP